MNATTPKSDAASQREPKKSSEDDPRTPRPYWIPEGLDLDDVSPDLQAVVAGVINPAYVELVLHAAPGLVQSTGITVIHLLWLEILEQLELAREGRSDREAIDAAARTEARAVQISRHLRLVHAKMKASELLHRLETFQLELFENK